MPPSMRVSRRGSKMRGQDSTVAQLNESRKSISGKPGQKNFVDPPKLFVGNLDYEVEAKELGEWLDGLGVGAQVLDCKVICDWRTRKSKGYGFVRFSDPIFATSALEAVKNKKLRGRVVRLRQGARKKEEPVAFVKPEPLGVVPEKVVGFALCIITG